MSSKIQAAKHSSRLSENSQVNSLANYLKDQRILAGYDVATLAEYSGVSVEVVLLLEEAPQRVSLDELYAVANVLNLDPGIVLELMHTLKPSRN